MDEDIGQGSYGDLNGLITAVAGVARDAGTKDNIVKRNVFKVVQATDNSGTL